MSPGSPGTRPWRAARSFAAFSAVLAASAACSSGAAAFPAISGEVGEVPSVDFSEAPGFDGVERLVVTEGTGDEVTGNDLVVSHQAVYEWRSDGTAQEAYSSYGGDPLFLPLPSLSDTVPEAVEALDDAAVGARLALAYPPSHPPVAQEREIEREDGGASTLVVYDVLDRYPAGEVVDQEDEEMRFDGDGELPDVHVVQGRRPQITVPRDSAPDEPTTTVLIEGDGEPAEAGASVVTQYRGVTWEEGTEFDSTWEYGATPAHFTLDRASVIEGWRQGLEGVRAGSRVLLTVPPDLAYGSEGNSAVDVAPDRTLVYVIDVLDVIPPS
ncbi:FKBP-type peptidyl-prolyl cis-trans isomerase [Nocardiopsis sp. RSe5-2]|uniref:peptidylprolyl isomerase n=1 Tax=Nocardiopsis endophytica TaxID=3018445 RepID=A0ABT4U2C5_9ACTN|nr:FKBP-type peptidyl-prolyl cis-trans isomerase [Nocardiopsis endophytica]MDA2811080.1 FKBP-type peptidyl-prolyl cis-trans isomerase [Nocardiopsis endophytica]